MSKAVEAAVAKRERLSRGEPEPKKKKAAKAEPEPEPEAEPAAEESGGAEG